jgi:hypothetical protein
MRPNKIWCEIVALATELIETAQATKKGDPPAGSRL